LYTLPLHAALPICSDHPETDTLLIQPAHVVADSFCPIVGEGTVPQVAQHVATPLLIRRGPCGRRPPHPMADCRAPELRALAPWPTRGSALSTPSAASRFPQLAPAAQSW